MTNIALDSYRFAVDLPATRSYYQKHSLCSCASCRNFYEQIRSTHPQLGTFLQRFGVDVARPDEVSSIETAESIEYIQVAYTVCGRIEAMGEYEIDLHAPEPISIVVHNSCDLPNEQAGECFTLCIYGIHLPWVLSEPFPASPQKRSRLHDFFIRRFQRP